MKKTLNITIRWALLYLYQMNEICGGGGGFINLKKKILCWSRPST